MNMLTTANAGRSTPNAHAAGVMVMTKQQAARSFSTGLSDKVRLFDTLGFEFNKQGDQLPNFKRTGLVAYKPRKDSNSFLAGILTQTDPLDMPIMAPGLMWVKCPVRAAVRPSVWMMKKVGSGYEGLHLTPSKAHTFNMDRKEGRVPVTAMFCTRWSVKAKPVPVTISEVLDALSEKFRLPEFFTVDCFNDRVFDVHGKLDVQDIDYNLASALVLTFDQAPERPFFDLDIGTITVEDKPADF